MPVAFSESNTAGDTIGAVPTADAGCRNCELTNHCGGGDAGPADETTGKPEVFDPPAPLLVADESNGTTSSGG
jgi:hypothetical protein